MKIGVVDYDAGNLRSVETALRFLGADFVVSQDPDLIVKVDRMIFPGVGDAGAAMRVLRRTGLDEAIKEVYRAGKLLFGICLGSQIIMSGSEETDEPCLGIIPGKARIFPETRELKVPHMGWNTVEHDGAEILFDDIPGDASFYFVHSYYPEPGDQSATIGTTEYGITFTSAVRKDNLFAVQFHPEKSGEFGLRMLRNFLSMKG